ncbi:MAG TPA: hypothetical protein VI278_09365, partial [Nitrososphaeraceae archaeon]
SGPVLEEYETFYELTKHLDKDLTSMFIQFAEEYFTDYTADRLHKPTVKSCLLRVPGSLNTKCIPNKGQDPGIKIIQRWDGKRPSIKPLLRDFRRWLIQNRIDDIKELKKQEKKHAKFQMVVSQKSRTYKEGYQNKMDRKRNTRNSTSRSQKIHNLENTFAISAQCKKDTKRRILFYNEVLAE